MNINPIKSPFSFKQRAYTKNQLCKAMGFKERRFTYLLTEMETRIKTEFPWYNKKAQILPLHLVIFIIKDYGEDPGYIIDKMDENIKDENI